MYSLLRYLPSILWKRKPIQLTFFVTRKCNARCPFCFYLKSAEQPANGAAELSLAEIERLAPSLGRLLWLLECNGSNRKRTRKSSGTPAIWPRTNESISLTTS